MRLDDLSSALKRSSPRTFEEIAADTALELLFLAFNGNLQSHCYLQERRCTPADRRFVQRQHLDRLNIFLFWILFVRDCLD